MRKPAIFVCLLLVLSACSGDEVTPQTKLPTEMELGGRTTEVATTIQPPTATHSPSPAVYTPTPIPSPIPAPQLRLCSPLEIHPLEELTEIIGDPYDPPRPGREERHHGIDFGYYHYQERDSMLGEPVQSILTGRVASVLDGQYPYGNMVIIESAGSDLLEEVLEKLDLAVDQSLYVLYAHLDQAPMVALGEQVDACQGLGVVGMSGNTDIPHLHIETRIGPSRNTFESMRFYDTSATLEELETYELWRTSGTFQHFDPMVILGDEPMVEETPEGG